MKLCVWMLGLALAQNVMAGEDLFEQADRMNGQMNGKEAKKPLLLRVDKNGTAELFDATKIAPELADKKVSDEAKDSLLAKIESDVTTIKPLSTDQLMKDIDKDKPTPACFRRNYGRYGVRYSSFDYYDDYVYYYVPRVITYYYTYTYYRPVYYYTYSYTSYWSSWSRYSDYYYVYYN